MTMEILDKITSLEKESTHFGFAWPDAEMIIQQIESECQEIRQAIAQGETSARIQEEVGDLLHAALSLCIFLELDPEETLTQTTAKFAQRFHALKTLATQQGYTTLVGQPFAVLMQLWEQAKNNHAE